MRAAIYFLVCSSALMGQRGSLGFPTPATPTGVISGVVRGPNRFPLPGVTVVVTPDPGQRGAITPFQGVALTKLDGSYEVTQVPPGSYWVCPQIAMSDFLDPCVWSVQAPTVRVGAAGGSATAKQDVTLDKGEFMWVQVEDPAAALDKHKGGRGQFRLAVRSPRGETTPASPPIVTAERKLYRMLVPRNGRFRPVLDAEDFVLEHGPAASRGASPFGVETQLGAGEKRILIVNVRGGK